MRRRGKVRTAEAKSGSVVRREVGVQVSPPAPMVPAFEGKRDRDARRQRRVSSARANPGVSRAVWPPRGEGSGEGVPSAAAFGRLALPAGSPGGWYRDQPQAL